MASKPSLRGGARRNPLPPVAQAANRGFGMPSMPVTAGSPPFFAFCCFPLLPQLSRGGGGEAKNGPEGPFQVPDFPKEFGAGEGIRTLDPNLGNFGLFLRQASPLYENTR